MSIARFPRVYFRGKISFDPSLSNNFTKPDGPYDPVNGNLDVPAGTNLAQLRAELPLRHAGSWNHYGTHRVEFLDARVTGVSLEPNRVTTADPLVGKSLSLTGKLVDLNPIEDNGTQVYFDNLRLGDLFAGFEAQRRKRLFMRFLNFGRLQNPPRPEDGNGPATAAGAVWEVCFPKSLISWDNFASSPAIQALSELMGTDEFQGLALRIHTYRTLYYRNGIENPLPETPRNRTELERLYADGRNFSNAVYTMLLGVISPWHFREAEGHPSGRILLAVPTTPPPRLSTTFVEVDRENARLTIDLGETIPEVDIGLEKANIGDLSLTVDHNGATTTLATIGPDHYNRNAYEQSAGLIDIPVADASNETWEAIENGRLLLAGATSGLLSERELTVVVQDRDIYIDEGEAFDLRLQVRLRGTIPGTATEIHVGTYDGAGRFSGVTYTIAVNQNGDAILTISSSAPGFRSFAFIAQPTGDPLPAFPPRLGANPFQANVRFLPFDNDLAANTPDSALNWNWIYENIFAVFDVLNPVMSRPNINVPLSNRQRMEQLAGRILEVTAKSQFESAGYMPVTRELSAGKRTLLHRWCRMVLSGGAPPIPVPEGLQRMTTKDWRAEGEPRCPITGAPAIGNHATEPRLNS